MCDTEFTIEQGKLWMLQTRVGKSDGPSGSQDGRRHDEGAVDRALTTKRPWGGSPQSTSTRFSTPSSQAADTLC